MSVLQHCYSQGSQNMLRLASALAANFREPNDLMAKCQALWPDCDIYRGHTHFRVTVPNQPREISFYFDPLPDGTKYPEHRPDNLEMHAT